MATYGAGLYGAGLYSIGGTTSTGTCPRIGCTQSTTTTWVRTRGLAASGGLITYECIRCNTFFDAA